MDWIYPYGSDRESNHNPLAFQLTTETICPHGHIVTEVQRQISWHLAIQQTSALCEELTRLSTGEFLAEYRCSECFDDVVYRRAAIQRTFLSTLPSVLLFTLNRFHQVDSLHEEQRMRNEYFC